MHHWRRPAAAQIDQDVALLRRLDALDHDLDVARMGRDAQTRDGGTPPGYRRLARHAGYQARIGESPKRDKPVAARPLVDCPRVGTCLPCGPPSR